MVTSHLDAVGPDEVWSTWSADPLVLLALGSFIVLYRYGVSAARDRPAIAAMVRRRTAAAAGAVVTLVVALVSPLDAAAGSLFSAHMVQHLLLSSVAAPLLVLAAPFHTVRRALPPAGRRTIARVLRATTTGNSRRGFLIAGATVLALATMSVWHTPALYDAALRSTGIHALEHGTILGASAMYWSTVVHAARRSQTLASVAALAIASAHGAALGALLALAPRPWYGGHAAGTEAWTVDPLADQQVAGAIMWVPTAVVYLGTMAIVLHRALGSDDRPRCPDGVAPGHLTAGFRP